MQTGTENSIECPYEKCDMHTDQWYTLAWHIFWFHSHCGTQCWCGEPHSEIVGPAQSIGAYIAGFARHLKSVGAENLADHYLLSKMGSLYNPDAGNMVTVQPFRTSSPGPQ